MRTTILRASGALLLMLTGTTLSAQTETRTPWQGTFVKTGHASADKFVIDLPLPALNTTLKLERIGIEMTNVSLYTQLHRCQVEVGSPVLSGSEHVLGRLNLRLPKPIQFEAGTSPIWGIYNEALDLYVERSSDGLSQRFRVTFDGQAGLNGTLTVTATGYTVPKANP